MVGAFVQAGYRSSVAVLGMALVTNIYGSGAVVPMMMVGSVPLFNVFAVLILTLEGPTHEESSLKENLLKAGKDIVTNPILLAILLGMAASWFEIRFPLMLERGMGYVADMAMPQALVCIGASFQGTEALKKIKPTLAVTFIKLILERRKRMYTSTALVSPAKSKPQTWSRRDSREMTFSLFSNR